MDDKIGNKHICKECGEEIDSGLINMVNHEQKCLKNAPNESIEFHWRLKEINYKQEEFRKLINSIFVLADDFEKQKIMQYYAIGIPDGKDMRLYGQDMYNEFMNYIKELQEKYKIK